MCWALSRLTSIDEWLAICSNAAVLDVMEGQWRFAHDKLREGLLGVLADDERQKLHHQIAAGVEKAHADAHDEYAALISEHYEQAGQAGQAAIWYARAGKHAQATYASMTAIEFTKRH